ncbi:MAG: thiamine-phosphate kinase [candidate division Zixibacteria bacterium]|nr:thiamine-phosphate kinase [candidate division Zixibacteria bacterium]
MPSDHKQTPSNLKKIGEFGLIDLIKRRIYSKDKQVVVNIGDDAAIIRSSPDRLLIFTTDTLVDKIHFDLKYFTFEEIGWKAMVANLSDIAAMGGLPRYALVTVGLPKSVRVEEVLSIYKGASNIARRYNCKIIGGDTTLVPKDLFISIALLGEVEKKFLVTRNGAKKGDLICVTGNLGEAQAGLEFLKKHGRQKLSLVKKHMQPFPRINEARILVRNLKINSMIDISDGLSSELFHLTDESHLGALIYEQNIPISSKCLKLAPLLNKTPLSWALSSGEEYELLLTFGKKDLSKIEKVKSKVNISVIGEMVDKRDGVKLIHKSGRMKDLRKVGFVHF